VPSALMLSELNKNTYELQLGKIDLVDASGATSSPFKPFSTTNLRANTTVAVIREFHSTNKVTDITAGFNVFSQDRPTVTLRLPLAPAVAVELSSEAFTTPTKIGKVAACLTWNEQLLEWDNKGIFQPPGKTGIRKFCRNEAGTPVCYWYLECYSQHLSYFSVAGKPLDCKGVPLGTTIFDGCNVCDGDNSTCSGCDGVPNQFDRLENVKLDKTCSGHGQCGGGQRCQCCINSVGLVSSGKAPNSQDVCPWFGIMCSQFCTPDVLSDAAQGPPPGIKPIHCSGHGVCISNATVPVACECDDGYANRDGLCDYLVPIPPKPMAYELWLFLVAGLPIIVCGLFACFGMWVFTYYKKKAVEVGGNVVAKAVIEKLPKPTLEEVGNDLPVKDEEANFKAMRPSEQVAYMKKQEKKEKKKARNSANVIPFQREDFKHRDKDAAADIPEISAFLTTRAYETPSTVIEPESNKELMVTYERLKQFQAEHSSKKDTEALFDDQDRLEDLIHAASRNPVSLGYPTVELEEVNLEGVGKGVKKQVEAERRAKQKQLSHMPDFLKGHMRKQGRLNRQEAENKAAVVKVDLETATKEKKSSDSTSDTSSTSGPRSNGAETAVVVQANGNGASNGNVQRAVAVVPQSRQSNGGQAENGVAKDKDGDIVANV